MKVSAHGEFGGYMSGEVAGRDGDHHEKGQWNRNIALLRSKLPSGHKRILWS